MYPNVLAYIDGAPAQPGADRTIAVVTTAGSDTLGMVPHAGSADLGRAALWEANLERADSNAGR